MAFSPRSCHLYSFFIAHSICSGLVEIGKDLQVLSVDHSAYRRPRIVVQRFDLEVCILRRVYHP